jgi:hypothetical protein
MPVVGHHLVGVAIRWQGLRRFTDCQLKRICDMDAPCCPGAFINRLSRFAERDFGPAERKSGSIFSVWARADPGDALRGSLNRRAERPGEPADPADAPAGRTEQPAEQIWVLANPLIWLVFSIGGSIDPSGGLAESFGRHSERFDGVGMWIGEVGGRRNGAK